MGNWGHDFACAIGDWIMLQTLLNLSLLYNQVQIEWILLYLHIHISYTVW